MTTITEGRLAAIQTFIDLPIIKRLQDAECNIKKDGKIAVTIELTLDEVFTYQRLLAAVKGLCK